MIALLVLGALLCAWMILLALQRRPGAWDHTRQFARARKALASTRGGDDAHGP